MAVSQTYTTTDSLLNTGIASLKTYTAPGTDGLNNFIYQKSNPGNILWLMYTDPFGITKGSGTIKQNYMGNGTVMLANVQLTGLPTDAVVGYPFLLYGCDPYNDCYNGQPPQFPKEIAHVKSMIVDANYNLTCTQCPADVDILYDEWLIPYPGFGGGPAGAYEVQIFPYYAFAELAGCSFKHTLTFPATVNGVVKTRTWDEYVCGKGAGNAIQFLPHNRPAPLKEELSMDLMYFFRQAVTDGGLTSSWCVPGLELGTEFGDGATAKYTLKLTKLEIQETLQ